MRHNRLGLGLLTLLAKTLVLADDAPVVTNEPAGAPYIAKLPDSTSNLVRGAVVITSNNNGTGDIVQVSLSGLPKDGGEFRKHASPIFPMLSRSLRCFSIQCTTSTSFQSRLTSIARPPAPTSIPTTRPNRLLVTRTSLRSVKSAICLASMEA
jgi:hypothetical protein